MMYIRKEGEVYMLDRDNAVFSVPDLQFPSRQHVGQHLKETLVDGVRGGWIIFMYLAQLSLVLPVMTCVHAVRFRCITAVLGNLPMVSATAYAQ